ncbi:CWC27 Peptidyl-prolyl isomerase CWC27 [Candida maltosa Xu316]|uniref:PPIase cyclophilin-type domain-containing protein n=1 Tax=Candida maltosa (strain Xu316) TaxID=1245528 RepID=M3K217_CANMX|nr:hypothetical protein G210_0616 [Candida maltosa Xu316]
MSSLEPQTRAKVILHTTKGSIDIELWPKEFPHTCRLFLTDCLNQKLTNLSFTTTPNTIEVPNPSSSKFQKETNSRVKCKRGYVGVTGGSIFISLKELPQQVNNIIGKINQESFYNVLKISQGELDEKGNPLFPVSIVSSEVVIPYFDDLVKEVIRSEEPVTKKAKKNIVAVNYDDEEDEEEEEFSIKSAYDLKKNVDGNNNGEKEDKLEVKVVEERGEEQNNEEEEESEDDEEEESEDDEEEERVPIVFKRDPTIDSPYDAYLDLNDAESITYSTVKAHKFIAHSK